MYQVTKTVNYIIFMVAYLCLQQASEGEEYSKRRKL